MRALPAFTLIFLWARDCRLCVALFPRIRAFAATAGASFHAIEAGILDEDGQPQVPALYCSHPATAGLLLVGSACLDAVQHHLAPA